MTVDHDQLFKSLIEAFFREFMELFCADEAKEIDWNKVEFLRDEYFTDTRHGKRRRMDLVVRVGLKAGGEKFVLVHVELESHRPRPEFSKRMFKYLCQLYLRYELDVYPIALFSDDAKWIRQVADTFEIKALNQTVLTYRYRLIKLKSFDYRQFLLSPNPLAYALMAKSDFLRLILGAKVDSARENLLIDFVETYIPLNEKELGEFEQMIKTEDQYAEVRELVTAYEKKGIEKGIEKGMKKGRHEAEVSILRKLILQRFGEPDQATLDRLQAADSVTLEAWTLRLLDAKTLQDIFE